MHLAGSADARDVDPQILSYICTGLRDENPYCIELRFLGAEARERAEGIVVVPRMTNQPTQADWRNEITGGNTFAQCVKCILGF
jgi:hypothetical protein